jgi:glycosyltransferase involved in cell wall biosynthesis
MIKAIVIEHVPPDMTESNSTQLGNIFRKTCQESLPDVVQIESAQAYYCIRKHISWLKNQGVKIVLDCHNIEFQCFKDSTEILSPFKKIIAQTLVPRLKKIEVEIAKKADIIFACSHSDADFFHTYNVKTYVIPNGVDCEEFTPAPKAQKPTLIFMGGVKYSPNGDGLKFYLQTIHPKLRERIPNLRLLAIGADPAWLQNLGIMEDSSVDPLGFVPDVRPYLNEASIGICPIRYGAGTRIKILTYMAAGLPVVSTKKGAESVGYADGRDIIIADKADDFAEGIVKLLENKSYYKKIASNGRDFILQNYDWNVIGRRLVEIYNNELQ